MRLALWQKRILIPLVVFVLCRVWYREARELGLYAGLYYYPCFDNPLRQFAQALCLTPQLGIWAGLLHGIAYDNIFWSCIRGLLCWLAYAVPFFFVNIFSLQGL